MSLPSFTLSPSVTSAQAFSASTPASSAGSSSQGNSVFQQVLAQAGQSVSHDMTETLEPVTDSETALQTLMNSGIRLLEGELFSEEDFLELKTLWDELAATSTPEEWQSLLENPELAQLANWMFQGEMPSIELPQVGLITPDEFLSRGKILPGVSQDGVIKPSFSEAEKGSLGLGGSSTSSNVLSQINAVSAEEGDSVLSPNQIMGESELSLSEDGTSTDEMNFASLLKSAKSEAMPSSTTLASTVTNEAVQTLENVASRTAVDNNQAVKISLSLQSVAQPQWPEIFAERAARLASQNIQFAEIQLDPPELGPLQIRIAVQQDQAVVNFVTASPQVREALDQTMSRLREMLQEQGLSLVDAGVSDQQAGQHSSAQAEGSELDGIAHQDGQPMQDEASITTDVWQRNGIDDFV